MRRTLASTRMPQLGVSQAGAKAFEVVTKWCILPGAPDWSERQENAALAAGQTPGALLPPQVL